MKKIFLGLIAIILIVAIIFALIPGSAEKEINNSITSKLSFNESPFLEKEVELKLTINSIFDEKKASAIFLLPEGFELVEGNLIWEGELVNGSEKEISIIVKSSKEGYFEIKSEVFGIRRSSTNIFIEINKNEAIIGSKPENNWVHPTTVMAVPMPENNEGITSELIISGNLEVEEEITVIYRLISNEELLNLEGIQMSLVFPENGLEVVKASFPKRGESYEHDGQISWKGEILKDKSIEIEVTLKVKEYGWGDIYGGLKVQSTENRDFIQDVKIAEVYVDKYENYYNLI